MRGLLALTPQDSQEMARYGSITPPVLIYGQNMITFLHLSIIETVICKLVLIWRLYT